MGLSKQITYIGDFYEEAQRLKDTYGRTTLFTTGHKALDVYLGGGFGREDGYEIVLLYGPTGIGKSTVALNFVAPAMIYKKRVGLLILEDDMPDVSNRLAHILTPEQYRQINTSHDILCLPDNALTKSWNLDDLLAYLEDWFTKQKLDLILLDHLQFAFEGAESIKGENEYVAQRVFMQKLNQLMKRVKKTIILISHVNKANGSKGMDKIVGSGAISQAATKVIEIADDDLEDTIRLHLRKSRFTAKGDSHYCMVMKNGKMEPC